MSWPKAIYIDGALDTAARSSLPVPQCVIPNVAEKNFLTEEWQQLLVDENSWNPTALNTVHPEYTDFILVGETDPVAIGGGMVQWRREYAKVPSTHNEWETISYKFPAIVDIANIIGGATRTSRNAPTENVTCRIQHDYFLVGPVYKLDGTIKTTATNATPGDIDKVFATMFLLQGQLYGIGGIPDGTYCGAIWAPADALSNDAWVGGSYPRTTPKTDEYKAMVADAIKNEWGASVTFQKIGVDSGSNSAWVYLPASGAGNTSYGGQLVAEDSRLTRWKGNIYLRTTRYVLAI